jgi:hypothetical protein
MCEIVKAGLAGKFRSIRYDTRNDRINSVNGMKRDGESCLVLFLDMERMLSNQAFKQGRLGDALAHTGDEGRSTLR